MKLKRGVYMRKSIVCLMLVMILVLSSFGTVVSAAQPDRTYTYDENEAVPSTNAYQVKIVVDETITGTTVMKKPTDIFVDDQDRVFVLDSGNRRVLVLNKDYHCIVELKKFSYNGEEITLADGAQGLFFRETNEKLYIADTENNRILVSDLKGNVSKIYEKPVDELLDPETPYKPQKIIVDNMGIMYVTSGTVNTGAMMVDSVNNFLGFYGTNKVKQTAEVMLEYLWRSILTDAQNAKSSLSFQPVEFLNLYWTDDRFVYAVSPLSEKIEACVVKLNSLGNDVFPEPIDLVTTSKAMNITGMQLSDITVDKEGAVTVVEYKTGKLYQYDEGCNLLAVFGGIGYQKGLFAQPVSLESDSDCNLLVLDASKNNITVLEQTYYGQMIRAANYLYNEGRYQESIEPWMEVIRMNSNYSQAYVGLGKAYMSLQDYPAAMESFELGKDKEGYGEAKAELRDERVRENFSLIAAVVFLLMFGILGYDGIKKFASKLYWTFKK